jgi:hypothetical protein
VAKDHSEYLDEHYETFLDQPCFPALRMNPALFSGEVDEALSTSDEQLLLVLHCSSAELLVVSNKHILVYKVPQKSSATASVGKFVGANVLVNLPVVGEVFHAVHGVKEMFHGAAKLKHWISPSDRRETAQRRKDHMPPEEEGKETVWDLHDVNILAMIAGYRDRILLENGFGWKTKFKTSIEDAGNHLSEIAIRSDGISFKAGSNNESGYPSLGYAREEWSLVPLASQLLEQNRQWLETAGWTLEIDNEKVALRRGLSGEQVQRK